MWGTAKTIKKASTTDNNRLNSLITLHWLFAFWEIYLFTRQVSTIKAAIIVPPQFIGKMNVQDYKVKRGVAISKGIFVIITLFFKLTLLTMKLTQNFHVFLWDLTKDYSDEPFYRVAWYGAFDELSNHLFLLPINVTGYLLFSPKSESLIFIVFNQLLEILIATLSAAQMMMFLVWMTDNYGAQSLFYLPLIVNFIGLVFMAIFIQYVEPKTKRKLATTENAQLRDRLVTVTSDVHFPIDRIFIDDRVPDANAYFVGIFGAKMIAVSPGLMKIMSGHSVVGCVTHELGHWAKQHNSVLLVFAIVQILSMGYGWMYAYNNSTVYTTFGFEEDIDVEPPQAIIPVALWVTYVSSLMLGVMGGLTSLMMCRCEYAADKFAVPQGLGPSLKAGLMAMAAKSRVYPFHDRWFSAWYHQHPTVLQRIKRLDKAN